MPTDDFDKIMKKVSKNLDELSIEELNERYMKAKLNSYAPLVNWVMRITKYEKETQKEANEEEGDLEQPQDNDEAR